MEKGSEEIGVRFSSLASIWSSVFIVGAGAPGGVSGPWARRKEEGGRIRDATNSARRVGFIG
jgi:hypothetical protein